MALIAAEAVSRLPKKVWIIALITVSTEGVTRKWSDQFIRNDAGLLSIESEIAPFVAPTDLIAINSGEFPTPMYFAHRKGWLTNNEQLAELSFIDSLKAKNCKHIIILKHRFGEPIRLDLPLKKSSPNFDLYTF